MLKVIKNAVFCIIMILLITPNIFAQQNDLIEDIIDQFHKSLSSIPEDIRKLAIYNIEPDKDNKIDINSLQDQIITMLVENGKFRVIDRNSLGAILEEQSLSLTGAVKTTDMVKTGKLIGVDGFIFGSIESFENKIIMNIKLIEVESSAIVYSKKFIGESTSFTRLGIGWGFTTSPTYTSEYLCYRFFNVDKVNLYEHTLDNISASSMTNFTFSYKQGLQGLKIGYLGFDINYSHFSSTKDAEFNAENQQVTVNQIPYTYGLTYSISMTQINLKPKFYLSGKQLFGGTNDWINPYLGISLSMISFQSSYGGWNNLQSVQTEYQEKETNSDNLLIISPLLGIEFNLTKAISLYIESTILLSDTELNELQAVYVSDMNMEANVTTKSGITFNGGVKLYLNIF